MSRKLSTLALCAAAGALIAGTAHADTSKMKIAFSNNYAGNSWRQAMLKSYDIVTKQAVADHIVAAADVFTTADKEVPTQAAQIQNLILQGYNAIVINASSPDALNGSIKQACDAGIVVVSFDGIVTEPCAYRVVVDFKDYGQTGSRAYGEVPAQGREPPGNPGPRRHLDRRRDPCGHSRRREGASGVQDRLLGHRRLGSDDRAEGGRDRAALASADRRRRRSGRRRLRRRPGHRAAGKPRPTIIEGNRQDELQWWKEQKAKDGYTTWSASIAPGVSTLAFWVAQQVLDGNNKIPHDLLVPYLAFTQDDFEAELPKIQQGGVASHEYTQADAIAAIKANMK